MAPAPRETPAAPAAPPDRCAAAPGGLRPRPQLLSAAAALLLTLGLAASNGIYNPGALTLVTIAAAAALWAAAVGSPWRRDPESVAPGAAARATGLVLGLALAGGFASQLLLAPGKDLLPRHPLAYRLLAAAGAAVAASWLFRCPPRLRRLRFPLLLACFAAMGLVVLRASPHPHVDVFTFQQGAAEGLARGQNPYAIDYPNVYQGTEWYGSALVAGRRIETFPYPPLTVLLELPAWLLLGDVRYLLLGAMVLAAWAIRRLGTGTLGELAALVFLFQSRTFLVLEYTWTEPIVAAAWALALLGARRALAGAPAGPAAAGLSAGLLAASKQYSPLLLLPLGLALLALPGRGLGRAALWAAGVALAVTLPFVLWDPREFWRDAVAMQFMQPFRLDALSWLAAWARLTGRQLSAAPAFGLAGLALLGTLPRRPSLPQAALAASAAFLVLLLFNKQAFCNYYWLGSGLLLSACALLEGQPEASPC
jgi:hypothetical protein